MRRAFAALLSLLALALPARAQDPEPARGEKYALLVGVREYDPNELRSLPYSEADAEGLARVFLANGYKPQNVVLMTQKEGAQKLRFLPLGERIKKELGLLVEGTNGDDSLIVALAGHGVQYGGDRESYFCPADARLADKSTLIPLSWIYGVLERCPAAFKLLLVDACRNDPQSDNSRSRSLMQLESASRPQVAEPPGGVAALFSCSTGEKAYEHASLKHGVFFNYVIEGLSGAATTADSDAVTLPELELYVKRHVRDFVRAEYGVRQIPELFGRSRGLVPVVTLDRARTEYEKGKALAEAGQTEAAISALSEALRLNPRLAVASLERGRLRILDHAIPSGIDDFSAAIKNGLNTASVYNERGQAYLESHQSDRSAADHTEAIRLGPSRADSYAFRAFAWNQKGDHSRAMADANKAIELDPRMAVAYLSRGCTYDWNRDYASAVADFDQAIKLDPTFAFSFAARANTLIKLGRLDRAIADCSEAIRITPKLSAAWGWRGFAYNKQGLFARGIADLDEAIRLEPGNAMHFANRACAHDALKDYARALADSNEAIRLDPTNAWAYVNRSSAFRSMGNVARAVSDASEAIRLDPTIALAYLNRAQAYKAQRDYARAVSDASQAIRLEPTSAPAYLTRGSAHSFLNHFDQAYDDYSEAIRLDPRLAQAYMNRSKIIRVRGRDVSRGNATDRAKALALDPNVAP